MTQSTKFSRIPLYQNHSLERDLLITPTSYSLKTTYNGILPIMVTQVHEQEINLVFWIEWFKPWSAAKFICYTQLNNSECGRLILSWLNHMPPCIGHCFKFHSSSLELYSPVIDKGCIDKLLICIAFKTMILVLQVNMVLLETLRLYGPAIILSRKASKEMKLGNLTIPKDTHITIPPAIIHRNKKYWGEDANEFNPMRFAKGVKNAAEHPNALIAFSIGPRACIGQNFAIMEGKTVMALILQRFSFSLSPKYKHAPADRLTLQPQYGLPILLKPLQV